ncbi:DUF2520 domain-containing protein [Kribbia dieselivorans]|uniref:DUF2520 domain-containing protein n=1 Tax=Kribbia dieselivorans TaxID=331526 RepID=UPI000AB1184B|nr:DUF2520 domain-containing protein [Kribbia dieselivorans]
MAAALRAAGWSVDGPTGRGSDPSADIVLLCVPDAQIAAAAAAVTPRAGRLVGHCSGATGLDVLAPHEAFSLHPLMTVPRTGAQFAGVTAAVAGSTAHAQDVATDLALALDMRPTPIADADRVAYHAAASIASNFLLTLEDLAERLSATAGLPRDRLVPIVRATVENWAETGAAPSLTGPVARGDESTILRQRAVVAQRSPQDLELFDALVAATRRLAGRREEN